MDFGLETDIVHDFLEETEDSKIKDIFGVIDHRTYTSVRLNREKEMSAKIGVEIQGLSSMNSVNVLISEVNVNAHASASTILGPAA